MITLEIDPLRNEIVVIQVNNSFKLLISLYKSKYPVEFAAKNENLKMLKWLHKKNCPLTEHTFRLTAAAGNFDIMAWLHENECPVNEHTFHAAANHLKRTEEKSHLRKLMQVMQWLTEYGHPMPSRILAPRCLEDYSIIAWLEDIGYSHEPNCRFVKIEE